MTECNCLSSTLAYYVYPKSTKWWHKAPFVIAYPKEKAVITIHGDTLKEIETKRDEIKKQLEEKHGSSFEVFVYAD